MLRFGSLFAGIGGFDLGLERAGFECAWQVEIDGYANRVLETHWPHVRRFRDVRECGARNLSAVDLICGGFPCQPHSLAGKRQGGADERDLWGEFARIIRELKPRWVLAENVPGLLSTESGRFFGRVLRDLAACGYDAEWQCIPAAAFGAPHQRERIWIVAYAQCGWGRQSSLALDPAQGPFHPAQREKGTPGLGPSCQAMANSDRTGLPFEGTNGSIPKKPVFGPLGGKWDWWKIEPNVDRVVDGLPHRVDRIRCLGNSVVPQVVEWIGRQIMTAG